MWIGIYVELEECVGKDKMKKGVKARLDNVCE